MTNPRLLAVTLPLDVAERLVELAGKDDEVVRIARREIASVKAAATDRRYQGGATVAKRALGSAAGE